MIRDGVKLRVAIIGGGPTGITCAKYLLAEKCFETIDIYEQRDRLGGIWNLSSNDRTRRIPFPQLDPGYGSTHSSRLRNGSDISRLTHDSLEFESPLYDLLETNIPKDLMKYSDFPFPADFPLFPRHTEVLQYLETYASDVRNLVRFETQVQDVSRVDNPARNEHPWRLAARDLKSGSIKYDMYDAIIVASGHYTVPQTPNIPGMARWNETYPGLIMHSKAYRRPEVFEAMIVLVVGNSASGVDIASQIGQYSQALYLSGRSESIFGQSKVDWREDVDEVIEFLDPQSHDRAVRTKSGQIIDSLDAVIFATGYFYSYPFLSSLNPPIITDGLRTRNTYQHFLHIDHPELAFPVINMKVIPFGLAENQAAVIARLWSGRLPMPAKEMMIQWGKEEIQLKGDGKHFHVQKFPGDALQMNELFQWASSANKVSGLENGGQGKLGMTWDEKQVWTRSKFPAIKAAYVARGDDRRKVRKIEELGLEFEEWKKHASAEDMQMFREAKCPTFGIL